MIRECNEELGLLVEVQYLSGVYYHSAYDSQAFIFRCEVDESAVIILSDEHTEFRFVAISALSAVQKARVLDCIEYTGSVVSRKF